MAIVRFTGFESGAAPEVGTISGTGSIVSSGQRTGSYAFRVNPTTTGDGSMTLTPVANTGLPNTSASFTDGSTFGFAFKAVTLPAANEEYIARSLVPVGAVQWTLTITSGGLLKLYETSPAGTLLGTGSTAIGSTYVYIEVRVNNTTNAYDVQVNGVSEISGTNAAINGNTGQLALGKVINTNSQTVDFYYDDVYVDDAGTFLATTTSFPEVKILKPDAAGASAGWTNGTGTTFAEVDEVPPESDGTDVSYIQASATEDNQYSTFGVQSTATGGVTGTISAVEGYVWAKTGSTAGSSNVNIRVRNSGTNSDATGLELTTSYQGLHRVLVTDPATGSAWTSGGVDTVEIGMLANTIAQTQRFSAAYIFVLSTVSSGAATLTISVSDSITASESVTMFTDKLYLSVSDNITLSESSGQMLQSFVNKSEAITVTENTDPEHLSFINVSDTVTLSENVNRLLQSYININDTITVGESQTLLIPTLFVSVSDTVTTSENTNVSIQSGTDLSISVSDTITASENNKVLSQSFISSSDTVTASENVVMFLTLFINVSDNITLSENVSLTLGLSINVSDTLTLTENRQLMLESHINRSDSLTLSENTELSVTPKLIAVNDTITLTEAVSLFLYPLNVSVSDSVILTESISAAPSILTLPYRLLRGSRPTRGPRQFNFHRIRRGPRTTRPPRI